MFIKNWGRYYHSSDAGVGCALNEEEVITVLCERGCNAMKIHVALKNCKTHGLPKHEIKQIKTTSFVA